MPTGIQALMSDPHVWGSILLLALTWFLSSNTGHTVILAALSSFDHFVSKHLPANQATALEHYAAEAVQVAFIVGEKLQLDNTGRLAQAKQYLATKADQAGISLSKFDAQWLEAIIEMAWHDQKAAVLDQAAQNAMASDHLQNVTTSEPQPEQPEAVSMPHSSISDLPTVQVPAVAPWQPVVSVTPALPPNTSVSYTTNVAPVPAGDSSNGASSSEGSSSEAQG